MFGNVYTFETARDINELIGYYEDNAYYLIVEDEDHNEIYRTRGIERVIAATEHNYGTLIPEEQNNG